MMKHSYKYEMECRKQRATGMANKQACFFGSYKERDKAAKNGYVDVDAVFDSDVIILREEL